MKNRSKRRQQASQRSRKPSWSLLAAIAGTVAIAAVVIAIAVVNSKSVPKTASEAPIYAPLSIHAPAPAFAVTTIDGVAFDSNRIATPILLELFATWCPHCQQETSDLDALAKHFGNRLATIAVSASDLAADRVSPASADDVRLFAQRYGVTYPIAFDADLSVAKKYLQGGFPTIVVIDAKKRIAAIETGEVSFDRLVADVEKAGGGAGR